MNLTFRLWTDADEPNILSLMRLEYGGRSLAHADFFDWQYRQNPAGRAIICCCEDQNTGTMAGLYAVIPVPVRIMGKPLTGSLSLNTLTHPLYRHRGIFVRSAEAVYSILADTGVSFTYGFPNNNSYAGFVNKLHFLDVGQAAVFVRPHDLAALLSAKLPMMGSALMKNIGKYVLKALQEKLRVSEMVSEIDSFYNVKIEKLTEDLTFAIGADAKWLEWRYLKTPHRVHRIVLAGSETDPLGLAVFGFDQRLGTKIGLLMELMLAPNVGDQVVCGIMAHVFDCCEQHGCVATFALATPKSRKAQLLRASGFWNAPAATLPHPYNVIFRAHSEGMRTPVLGDMDVSFGMSDA